MFTVWTVTHPEDASTHESLYDAYLKMSELVEDGFEPLCKNMWDKILTYAEVREEFYQ